MLCWYFGASTCFWLLSSFHMRNLKRWVEYPFHIKNQSELSLLYANLIKILLFESIYSSALYCWIPEIVSVTDTNKAALRFVFPLGATQWKHNSKGKYSLGLSICMLPELWVPDGPELANSLFLLEFVTNKTSKSIEEMDHRKTLLRAQSSSLLYLATTLGLGVNSE